MLKPVSIEIFTVKLPLRKPFIISSGRIDTRDIIIIKLHDKSGLVGYGEAPTLNTPIYKPDYPSTVINIFKDVIGPHIFGKSFDTPMALDDSLAFIRGHYFAKAALSIAAYDLYGKQQNKTLQEIIGGTRQQVEYSKTVSIYADVNQSIDEAREFHEDEGIRLLKLKTKPGNDLANINALLENFPACRVMIDANASYAYTPETVALYKAIDQLDLLCIEQPLAWNDLVFHAKLQEQIKTPIALDESIDEVSQVKQAAAIKSCGAVNIKIPRVGGLTESLRIHDFCVANNMPVWIGGMIESPISAMSNLAFATKEGCVWPADFMETFSLIAASDEILAERPFTIDGCMITPRFEKPGLGIQIDEKALARYTVMQQRVD